MWIWSFLVNKFFSEQELNEFSDYTFLSVHFATRVPSWVRILSLHYLFLVWTQSQFYVLTKVYLNMFYSESESKSELDLFVS